jgi:hypothetical protein
VLRGRYLRRGGRVRDFVSTTHVLEKGLRWIPRLRDEEHEEARRRLLSWIIHLILRQFRIDVITAHPSEELRDGSREEALEGMHPFTFAYFETIMVEPVYLTSGNRSPFKPPSRLGQFLFQYDDGRIRQHWDGLPYRTMYRRTRESLSHYFGRDDPVMQEFHRRFWRQLYLFHWIFPVPTAQGLLQKTKESRRMFFSLRPIFKDGQPERLTMLHRTDAWEWARKDAYADPPLPLPAEASWTDEDMRVWIERRVGFAL